eukprot:6147634-Pyramimonas_sp.AAC.1
MRSNMPSFKDTWAAGLGALDAPAHAFSQPSKMTPNSESSFARFSTSCRGPSSWKYSIQILP